MIPERELRLWPGIAAVCLGWLLWLALPRLAPDWSIYGFLGAMVCGLAVIVWWLFFSRAPRLERWLAVPLMIAALALTRATILHPSIQGGMMGLMIVAYGIPVATLALVLWAVFTRRWSPGSRRAALVTVTLLVCAGFALLRTDGMMGQGGSQLAWRWTPEPEERVLAEPLPPPAAAPPTSEAKPQEPAKPAAPAPMRADWPGFRGLRRDSVVAGVRIHTDWNAAKPQELWRRPVGPGWSSFAAGEGLIFTQEQRGEDEVISCYRLKNGQPVWAHRDKARFWESNGGAGPRATPALHDGRIYALGATGILNALDARTGALLWKRNAAADTGAKLPGWGFSGSPLVVGDVLVVAASGVLAGYDLATGTPRWIAEKGAGSYSSPHLMTLDGVPQVILMSSTGTTSVSPSDGKVLWKHPWEGYPIVQPSIPADGGILVTTADATGALGIRRLTLAHGPGGWTQTEVWTSRGLKPYFNDSVIHNGHAYGFDGAILSCIDLRDGTRKWKGGRYGHGQMLLLRDQDLLLIVSEEGELALVEAKPDGFIEVARVPALEGKTWNHPALVGNVLLIRNGAEMAAFRLAPPST